MTDDGDIRDPATLLRSLETRLQWLKKNQIEQNWTQAAIVFLLFVLLWKVW